MTQDVAELELASSTKRGIVGVVKDGMGKKCASHSKRLERQNPLKVLRQHSLILIDSFWVTVPMHAMGVDFLSLALGGAPLHVTQS